MSGQGFPYEGSDKRFTTLWGFAPWLSRKLTFSCPYDPISIFFTLIGFGMNIPVGKGKVLHLRLCLYRYDRNVKAYIFFSAACKVLDHPVFY